jgi:hypothetical protein
VAILDDYTTVVSINTLTLQVVDDTVTLNGLCLQDADAVSNRKLIVDSKGDDIDSLALLQY